MVVKTLLYNLKTAKLNDLRLLGEIRNQAIMAQPETFWSIDEKRKAAEAWRTMDVQRNFQLYTILVTDDDSAFIGWKENYLGYLFLLPRAQDKGVGSKLLELAENEIGKKYDHIWLFAHPYSERFYEERGFIKQVETENPFGTRLLHKFQKNF